MEWHHIWRSILIIISIEVLLKPFKHFGSIVAVQNTLIQVWAVTTFVSLHVMGVQRNFPSTYRNSDISILKQTWIALKRRSVLNLSRLNSLLNVFYKLTFKWFCWTSSRLAFVWNPVVQGIRPYRYLGWRNTDRTVIYESIVFDYLK